MKPTDVAHYRARAQQERERAQNSADAEVAQAHENLALMYERLVAGQPDDSGDSI